MLPPAMAPTLPLFLLAFDHRQSLVKGLFGGDADAAAQRAPDLKLLVLGGLRQALEDGGLPVAPSQVGVLVDDRYGAKAARAAREDGFAVAVAVEETGQREVRFVHGEDFAAHVTSLEPAFAKVLVRYNADDPEPEVNARQRALLARLSDWCTANAPDLLLELLVPPTPAQLEAVGGDPARYDAQLRPGLTVRAMEAMRADGIAPALWKIEGLETPDAARSVAAAAGPAPCLVLGRGADDAKVDHWLTTAAPIPNFAGFAIGRSLWWDPARRWLSGTTPAPDAEREIATAYRRAIDVYVAAAAGARA